MRMLLASAMCLFTLGCSGADLLGMAAGAIMPSAPGVSANVQAGKTNTQTLGQTELNETVLRDVTANTVTQNVGDVKVRTNKVERIVINETPAWTIWVVIVGVLGWVAPSPAAIYRKLVGVLRSRKERLTT